MGSTGRTVFSFCPGSLLAGDKKRGGMRVGWVYVPEGKGYVPEGTQERGPEGLGPRLLAQGRPQPLPPATGDPNGYLLSLPLSVPSPDGVGDSSPAGPV